MTGNWCYSKQNRNHHLTDRTIWDWENFDVLKRIILADLCNHFLAGFRWFGSENQTNTIISKNGQNGMELLRNRTKSRDLDTTEWSRKTNWLKHLTKNGSLNDRKSPKWPILVFDHSVVHGLFSYIWKHSNIRQ